MEFLEKIRRLIFKFILRRKTVVINNRQPITLNAAKKIGILFNAEDIKNNHIIVGFATHLKSLQKEVQLLAYLPKRAFGFQYPFPYITLKDTNWYGKPGGGTTGFFMRSPFDLMINFSTNDDLPLEYISAVSPANFRVGFNKAADNANYDLILIPKENKNISNLIQNLEHYLK